MAREKADYRDILARLDEAFPGRETVSKAELAEWLGVSPRTLRRRYTMPGRLVTKTVIARKVATS